MNATASNRNTTRDWSASCLTAGTNWKSTNSRHTRNVVTKKSYTPATRVAWRSSFACDPPFSPVTRISVIAVASGNGYAPCVSRTK
jgi:hypothetical protein